MSPEPIHDVAIIGAGMVGLSAGLELQARGRSVIVIDPGDERARASFGNAGVLSRGSIIPVAGPGIWKNLPRYARNVDASVRLRYGSMPAILPWLRRFLANANVEAVRRSAAAINPLVAASFDRHLALGEIAGTLPLIRHNGWLRLYRKAETLEAAALERELFAAHGVATEILRDGEIYELEPSLARRYSRAVLFPQTGSVESPGEVVRRYEQAFRARGGSYLPSRATDIRQIEGGVEIRTQGPVVKAGHAVLAAGAWSAALARRLGYRIPFAAERGYHVHHRLRDGARLNRPVNDVEGGFVVSPMGDTVRVLSGVELGGPDLAPNFRQLETILRDAAATVPLGEQAGERWVGSRPSTPDSLPVICRSPGHDRVIFAFGHGHIGFSTGPVTGEVVAKLICGEAQTVPIEPFDVRRFQ